MVDDTKSKAKESLDSLQIQTSQIEVKAQEDWYVFIDNCSA